MKLLHVSVTVVSLSGVHFKESSKTKNTDVPTASGVKVYPKTTVVASFARDDQDAAVDDHIRSLPLDLSSNSKDASNDMVAWPTEDKSTFHFERYFLRQNKSKSRKCKKEEAHLYASQTCRVQLAVCRKRRWFKLGDADLVIHGDEREANMTVPLINHDTPKSKKGKGKNVIPMARLKGETLKCGLGKNAALRVIVNVSEHPLFSWEYDPAKAAVVKKNKQVVNQEENLEEQGERKSESLDTIEAPGAVKVRVFRDVGQESSELTKNSSRGLSLPPTRSTSVPHRQNSASSSRPDNILNRIMSATSEPASPQASIATLRTDVSTCTPPQIPSPIRVSSPMRNISPFRALSPFRQRSAGSSVNKVSLLDRVVTITSDAAPALQEKTLSQHIMASSPPKVNKGNDQTVYFIEHGMQQSDESASPPPSRLDPPASDEWSKARTRSSNTQSTEFSSQMSTQTECTGFNSKYSTFTHSQNSAFTSASGYSSANANENHDMDVIMSELLTKTPSELYAIIHDIDPKEARNIKKEHEEAKQKKSYGVEEDGGSKESDHSDDSGSTYDYPSVGESSFFYDDDSCSSKSESYISFQNERRTSKSNSSFFTEKTFGKRFLCNFPFCGIGREGDGRTLSYVDDDESYVN